MSAFRNGVCRPAIRRDISAEKIIFPNIERSLQYAASILPFTFC